MSDEEKYNHAAAKKRLFEDLVVEFTLPPHLRAQQLVNAGTHAFHLPGQHDQRSHGRGGVGAHTSVEEARIAQKLNAGKKLDPSVPSEARAIEAIHAWTHGASTTVSTTDMSDSVAYAIHHDPDADTLGGMFARMVAAAPPGGPKLHRGMAGVQGRDIPHPGDTFDLEPTSFTRSTKVMDDFARPGIHEGEDFVVRQHVKKGSRALRIDRHAGSYEWEEEHVALGRYRVTGRREGREKFKVGGKVMEVKTVDLDIEQIEDMDGPPSFTPFHGVAQDVHFPGEG